MGDYPSDVAVSVLESLVLDRSERERRAAASTLAKLALQNKSVLNRLKRIMDDIPTGEWERQSVYQTISARLQYGGPPSDQQLSLDRFLLERASVDTQLFDMLDEILCREVPKWRASRQRAENATKMIREHPDDARLVAFFETVRTNALESARMAVPSERRDSAPPPVSTNRVSEAGAPAAPNGNAAVSDPWAGLLDDLPEKKPWTPPPGYEPPFGDTEGGTDRPAEAARSFLACVFMRGVVVFAAAMATKAGRRSAGDPSFPSMILGGHPLNAPAQRYQSLGVERRPTP
jgi:hypothetical protein